MSDSLRNSHTPPADRVIDARWGEESVETAVCQSYDPNPFKPGFCKNCMKRHEVNETGDVASVKEYNKITRITGNTKQISAENNPLALKNIKGGKPTPLNVGIEIDRSKCPRTNRNRARSVQDKSKQKAANPRKIDKLLHEREEILKQLKQMREQKTESGSALFTADTPKRERKQFHTRQDSLTRNSSALVEGSIPSPLSETTRERERRRTGRKRREEEGNATWIEGSGNGFAELTYGIPTRSSESPRARWRRKPTYASNVMEEWC